MDKINNVSFKVLDVHLHSSTALSIELAAKLRPMSVSTVIPAVMLYLFSRYST